jgi:HTH domain of spoOJ/parA/parB/repB family protein
LFFNNESKEIAMPKITPFQSVRPNPSLADRIAALPYDVYNREEACIEVKKEPLSFLKIDRAETQFDNSVDTYDDRVYEKARETLDEMIADGSFLMDEKPCFYVYELTMNGRSQTGIVACSSIDDYVNGTIRKHENTREEKEIDRINHVDRTNAQTGPIFLVYRSVEEINRIIRKEKEKTPVYDFTSPDGITHRAWVISDSNVIEKMEQAFAAVPTTYIADGHHRCASAVKVGLKRRKEHPDYTGQEEFNHFLSVLFPDDQLYIMPYNRVVKDLAGMKKEEFLEAVRKAGFTVSYLGDTPFAPEEKGTFGMYLNDGWYRLTADKSLVVDDPVEGLDVSILQNNLLRPILKIADPRTDKRIDFVGGIRGLSELEKRVAEDCTVAFSMYATSIQELLDVADAGLLMPPKSTWFEPKLRSGLFIHRLD